MPPNIENKPAKELSAGGGGGDGFLWRADLQLPLHDCEGGGYVGGFGGHDTGLRGGGECRGGGGHGGGGQCLGGGHGGEFGLQ